MTDPLVARAGDPDLDRHLEGVRLTSVVESPGDDHEAEAVLEFDGDGTMQFGLTMIDPASQGLAQRQLDILRAWQHHGTLLEVTAAPGKWTLLRGGGLDVVLPRSE